MKKSLPPALEIRLAGLPTDCDLERLKGRAAHLADLLEEVGCYPQDGPSPCQVFRAGAPEDGQR